MGALVWLVWIVLPMLTTSVIWVRTTRHVPLPIITAASRGLTIDLSMGEVAHIITAYNGGEPWTPSEVVHTVDKVSKRFSESGRSACKIYGMVADLVGQ